jgi:hypothetical protein
MPSTGVRMRNNGDIAIRKDGGVNDVFQVFKDGAASGNKTLSIFNDGSADFASNVSARTFLASTENDGFGTFISRNLAGTNTATIYQNGSATFASSIQSGGSPLNGTNNGTRMGPGGSFDSSSEASTEVFRAYTTGDNTPKVLIKADGSAEFAGEVQVGGNAITGTETGITLRDSGLIQASRPEDTYAVFAGYTTGNSDATSVIQAGGSATFGGDITTTDSNGDFKILLRANTNGRTYLMSEGSSDNNIYIRPNNRDVGIFKADGTATFTGALTCNNYLDIYINTNNTAFQVLNTGSGSTAVKVRFKGDGSAMFDGTVTANGSVLTRANGTTLDLGDRAEKVDAALNSLKTALASISDFAQLKAALVTALADI